MHLHPSKQPPHVFFACDPDDADWHRGCDRLHEKMVEEFSKIRKTMDLQARLGAPR